jgi:hypothetical protein
LLLLRRSISLRLLECVKALRLLRVWRAVVLLTLAQGRRRILGGTLLVRRRGDWRLELRRSWMDSSIWIVGVRLLALTKRMIHGIVGHLVVLFLKLTRIAEMLKVDGVEWWSGGPWMETRASLCERNSTV